MSQQYREDQKLQEAIKQTTELRKIRRAICAVGAALIFAILIYLFPMSDQDANKYIVGAGLVGMLFSFLISY